MREGEENQPGEVQTVLRVRVERFWFVKEAKERRVEVFLFSKGKKKPSGGSSPTAKRHIRYWYCRTTWRHLTGRQATPGIGPVVWFDWMAVRDVGMGGLG
ncbi:hypothetical protein DEO72_LG10g2139 [Vigna unguiculata]|uniref:Uncharacterized protein n=1 Tax=Vigna unguiculata TaxID=3917 RepID=A0A4D6NAZ9_VIGUN|nr:hypothetical protein DEO72_LG10g2139 [Vigna unguiculata]